MFMIIFKTKKYKYKLEKQFIGKLDSYANWIHMEIYETGSICHCMVSTMCPMESAVFF